MGSRTLFDYDFPMELNENMTSRYLKLDKEDTFADGGAGDKTQFLKVADVDFQTEYEWNEIEEANRPFLEESYQTQRTGGGSFSMWGRADEMALILHSLFGKCIIKDVGTPGESPYQMNFEPDIAELFSLAISVGKDDKAYKYKGQMIQSVTITAEVGEVMTIEVETFGNGGVVEDKDAPNYVSPQDNPMFTLRNAVIDLGGEKRTDVQSITITIELNISEDEHTLGSFDIQNQPPAQRRNIEIDMEFQAEDDDLYQDFLDGTTAELITTFETTKKIESGYPYGFKMIFPRIQYREFEASISGRDPIRSSVPAVALYDSSGYEYDQGDGDTKNLATDMIAILTGSLTDTVN